MGGIISFWWATSFRYDGRHHLVLVGGFARNQHLIPIIRGGNQAVVMFEAFYRSGALVFGGGHVVLPLLQAEVITRHWLTSETFLAGYGLTQAMPGPLFTFAAYLGAVKQTMPCGLLGSAIALVAIFLPGLLLVYGMPPFWDDLRNGRAMQAAMRGANAAVVGILGLTLYDRFSKARF